MTQHELERLRTLSVTTHNAALGREVALKAAGLELDNVEELNELWSASDAASKSVKDAEKQFLLELTAVIDDAWKTKSRVTARFTGSALGGHTDITGWVFKNADGQYGLQKTVRSKNGYLVIGPHTEIINVRRA
jgi:hypothetical protein